MSCNYLKSVWPQLASTRLQNAQEYRRKQPAVQQPQKSPAKYGIRCSWSRCAKHHSEIMLGLNHWLLCIDTGGILTKKLLTCNGEQTCCHSFLLASSSKMVHAQSNGQMLMHCDTAFRGYALWTTNKQDLTKKLAVARADGLSGTCSMCHDSDPGHLPLIGQVDGRQAFSLSKSSSRQCQAAASLQKARMLCVVEDTGLLTKRV